MLQYQSIQRGSVNSVVTKWCHIMSLGQHFSYPFSGPHFASWCEPCRKKQPFPLTRREKHISCLYNILSFETNEHTSFLKQGKWRQSYITWIPFSILVKLQRFPNRLYPESFFTWATHLEGTMHNQTLLKYW